MARTTKVNQPELSYREYACGPETVNEADRSIGMVAATEEPVPMWDYGREEVVPEILLMSGVRVPKSGMVPMQDCHKRDSTKTTLGSVRGLGVEGKELHGRAMFSSTAEDTWIKYKEGHLRDFSVGYRKHKQQFVPAGQKAMISGREFPGPVNVVTSWSVHEISATPIGADPNAKSRSDNELEFEVEADTSARKDSAMNALLKRLLATRGLAATSTDEQAVAWLVERGMPKETASDKMAEWVDANFDKLPTVTAAQRTDGGNGSNGFAGTTARMQPGQVLNLGRNDSVEGLGAPTLDAKAFAAEVQRELRVAQEADRARQKALGKLIADECKRHNFDAAVASRIADEATDEISAYRMVSDLLAERQPKHGNAPGDGHLSAGPAQYDKHIGAIRHALLSRSVGTLKVSERTAKELLPEAPPPGTSDYRHATMFDLARACAEIDGYDVRRMSREDIARAALGFGRGLEGLQVRHAVHTTASFQKLTLDAMNKSLLAGYREAPSQWRICFNQGASSADFKNIHRVKLGESPSMPIWPDNKPMNQVSFADEKETYAVEARAVEASFSWKLIVNDDLGGLTRLPAMLGTAAERTVNENVFAILTMNSGVGPTMSDAVALFSTATGSRKKDNYITGAGAPSVSTLQSLGKLMRTQVGLNTPEGNASGSILNLEPRFIIAPEALRTTVLQLVRSAADPASSNSGVYNPASEGLTPVIVPLLDSSSTVAWYLACSPMQCDTIEVTFLQGQETPVIRDYMDDKTWAIQYQVVQSFGVKAIDFRGLAKHKGEA